MTQLWGFLSDERGATAIEYGLIAALIAILAIVGMATAGTSVRYVFNYSADKAGNVWDSAG
jgi:pilus assembly protein Flp/PilA